MNTCVHWPMRVDQHPDTTSLGSASGRLREDGFWKQKSLAGKDEERAENVV